MGGSHGYYRAICINELNFKEYDIVSLENEIINTIKGKTIKALYNDKRENYNDVDNIYDIEIIENLLFTNKLNNKENNININLKDIELDILYGT